MKNFIISNYVLILSILLITIITLIGYFVDRNRIQKKTDNSLLDNTDNKKTIQGNTNGISQQTVVPNNMNNVGQQNVNNIF